MRRNITRNILKAKSYKLKAIQSGQTFLEAVIALAIFSFIVAALVSMVLGGIQGSGQGSEHTLANAFAQEGVDAVRSIRNGTYNELRYASSGASVTNNQWVLSGNGTSDSRPPFTRKILLDDVCRTQVGDITPCPGSYTDAHTKRATSKVTWITRESVQNSVERIGYISNWDSRTWAQSDWIGGSGQSIWSASHKYGSDDTHIDISVAGQASLSQSSQSGNWSLHTQIPSGHHLQDISVVSSQDIWAVGDNGLIVHYNGTTWNTVSSPTGDRLDAISMISATDGWAVGDGGKIIHYNGTSWSLVTSPSTDHLNAISMISATDGWAVGAAGKILRYNGTSWSEFSDTGGNTWYAIHMLTATDGWLVGNQGLIYRWNGSTWSNHTDTGGTVWSGVYMLSATDGWVIGDQGNIYRWNGTTWSLHTDTGGDNWNDVHIYSSTDGFIVGQGGKILHWNGTAWIESTPFTYDLNGVTMISPTLSWAVGVGGLIFRYQPSAYYTSGQVTSSAFSFSDPSPVQVVEWDALEPSCTPVCDVRLQIRTAPDSGGAPGVWTSWYGSTGIDTYFTVKAGSLIPIELNGNTWAQYRVTLRGNGTQTPTLQEVRVDYK